MAKSWRECSGKGYLVSGQRRADFPLLFVSGSIKERSHIIKKRSESQQTKLLSVQSLQRFDFSPVG